MKQITILVSLTLALVFLAVNIAAGFFFFPDRPSSTAQSPMTALTKVA
jgi:hypothetical protein